MTTRLQHQQLLMAAQQQAAEAAANLSSLDGKNRKSYTLTFKRQVINFYHAHAGNISLAAKMFDVDRKMVRSWVEQEDFLRQSDSDVFQAEPLSLTSPAVSAAAKNASSNGSFSLVGGAAATATPQRKRLDRNFTSGSSARYPELEAALTDWRLQQLSRGQEISTKSLKTQALRLFHELYPHSPDQDFKASTGWLQRYVTRIEASAGAGINGPPSGGLEQAINRRFVGDNAPVSAHSKSSHHYPSGALPAGRSEMQRSLNQHPALHSLPQLQSQSRITSSEARDRAAPYLVPIKPKPSSAASPAPPPVHYEMPVIVAKQPQLPVPMSNRRNSDVRTALDDRVPSPSGGPADMGAVQYVIMTHQERTDMERQSKEASRFFTDCRDFLTFLEKIEI